MKLPVPLATPLAVIGCAALLIGALAMHASGSMLPMALAASTSLMLTLPLVRHLLQPQRTRR